MTSAQDRHHQLHQQLELPVATSISCVDMRLAPGAIRELHWHKQAEWAYMLAATPRLLISGIAEITGSHGVSQAGAVLGFLLAAVSMYTAFALLLEDVRHREVLPIGRQGGAREATHGRRAVELRDIERAPGVRSTL